MGWRWEMGERGLGNRRKMTKTTAEAKEDLDCSDCWVNGKINIARLLIPHIGHNEIWTNYGGACHTEEECWKEGGI
jgi:hypothetical protein